jgi:predicted lipid carrier protein YhbT
MMDLSQFRFPAPFQQLGKWMPTPLATAPLMLALEIARRKELLVAPDTLYGKTFRIQVEDLGLSLCFYCDQGSSVRSIKTPEKPKRMSACRPARQIFSDGVRHGRCRYPVFRRRLRIEGNTELGVAVKYWIDASERPAWLSRFAERFLRQPESV